MRLLFGTLFGLAVAAMVGLGLTYYALTRGAAFGGLTIEGGTAWPKSGTTDADPTNYFPVDLSQSAGILQSGTQTDAFGRRCRRSTYHDGAGGSQGPTVLSAV